MAVPFCVGRMSASGMGGLSLLLFVVAQVEERGDALVEEHGEEGDHHALEKVEGDHGEEDQGGHEACQTGR